MAKGKDIWILHLSLTLQSIFLSLSAILLSLKEIGGSWWKAQGEIFSKKQAREQAYMPYKLMKKLPVQWAGSREEEKRGA